MALYDFSYKTGSTFGTMYSPKDDTCYEDYYFSNLSVSSPDITGLHSTRMSCNGQTIVEQKAVKVAAGFDSVYLNSGDYYFKSGETYRGVSFNENFSLPNSRNISFFYNLKDDKREVPMGTGNTQLLKQLSLNTQITDRFPDRKPTLTGLSSFDYFANGQKIYSGLVSGSYSITGSPVEFYYNDTYSGKIFAIPKNTGIKNYTGLSADVFGDKYVESTVFGYVNGVSLHRNNWAELSTGVTLIRTGLQASIFEPVQETAIIQL